MGEFSRRARFSDSQLDSLLGVLSAAGAPDFRGYRRGVIIERAAAHASRAGLLEAEQYVELCRSSPAERDDLVAAITVHHSRFFRNPEVFHRIEAYLRSRLAVAASPVSLRVWSAGCASGEEAYTMAMVLRGLRERLRPRPEVSIFATDIDATALVRARKAVYPRSALDEVRLGDFDQYFVACPDGYQLLTDDLPEVHFSTHDLTTTGGGTPAAGVFRTFDVVLCRNVLIYLSVTQQRAVFSRLLGSLAPGGLLVLGKVEGSLATTEECLDPEGSRCLYLRR